MFVRTLLVTFAFFLFCLPAMAQTVVSVRTGKHDGYTRAVFDWPYQVPYEIAEKAPDELLIRFSGAADMAAAGDAAGGPDILALSQISTDGTNLEVSLRMAQGRTFRHFSTGSRVVIDVMAPETPGSPKKPKENPKAAPPVPAPAAPESSPPASPSKAAAPPEKLPALKPGDVETQAVDSPQTIIEKSAPKIPPHVITVSTTESVGLSVFKRAGWLWIVADRPGLAVPPQIEGEQVARFGAFERMDVNGGVAWRLKLPPENEGLLRVYGEGGGLVWRLVLTPNERESKPVEMERHFPGPDSASGEASVSWAFPSAGKVLDVSDPAVGDVLRVVTVGNSAEYAGPARDMVDFNTLESFTGLAVQPEADDLQVTLSKGVAAVSRQGGLAVSGAEDIARFKMRADTKEAASPETAKAEEGGMKRIFDFDRWVMGGVQALTENQRILLSGAALKDKNGRAQDLLTLAKMNISNDRGQEALGFLSYAADELPGLSDTPEYKALKGGAAALAGKFETAFNELWHPSLMDYGELDYWRAFTLAGLEDWQQASDIMPKDLAVLDSYPRPLLEKIGLKLAEVALRAGDVEKAVPVFSVLDKERPNLNPWTLGALDYLEGESERQSKKQEEAKKLWTPLVTGQDDLYRAKAGLALTMLELEEGNVNPEQAIDRLEGLRYAWRGDELEAQINYTLGKLYVDQGQYLKGFTIMRDSAGMSPDSDISRAIPGYMKDAFKQLLMKDEDLNPLDAVQVYEEFRELTPDGAEGDKLVQKLAERLVHADLLDRAAAILANQVDYRLQGEEKARVALRLGAIFLLDNKPQDAMKYLATGRDLYAGLLKDKARDDKLREIDMLRARGLSDINRTEEALEILHGFPPAPDVNRLRADIAWQAQLWDDAAEALDDLILDEGLDLNRPLTAEQADLILNYAVALNLAGNRVALANAGRRYEDAMKKTPRARLFDVVTRPRKTSILADKETIDAIVKEVDMFSEFLDAYRADTAGSAPAPVQAPDSSPAPVQAPAPAEETAKEPAAH